MLNSIFQFIEAQRPFDRALLKLFLFFTFATGVFALLEYNDSHLKLVPARGGSLIEGVVGTPRFINPVLTAASGSEMVELIYAGLMTVDESGTLVPEMAESVNISNDGLTYSIILKNSLTFHDGKPVTANDVLFTIGQIQDPNVKSPLFSNWEGVRLERVSEREINMILAKPYGPFLENLTVGILPEHIWDDTTSDTFPFSQYNTEPIGSGPYMIDSTMRTRGGILESFTLRPFKDYAGTRANIQKLSIRFYPGETELLQAWNNKEIQSISGIGPEDIKKLGDISLTHVVHTVPLPRTFAVFFNQNEAPVLRDKAVRRALSALIDRDALIRDALLGAGYPLFGPIPTTYSSSSIPIAQSTNRIDEARNILQAGGWVYNSESNYWQKNQNGLTLTLAFTLATANNSALARTAELLKTEWNKAGIRAEIKQYEQVDLTQEVIRPRKFDALLFGTVIGREMDFYPFWHSSQRSDPGLNIALYTNTEIDSLLEKARTETSHTARIEQNKQFAQKIEDDVPALFLFTPSFTYIVPKNVQGVTLTGLVEAHERFANIHKWHSEQESIWDFLQR
jgi:peptide/nickel transport system substrate-binding protein